METIYYSYPNPVHNKNAGIEIRSEYEMTTNELALMKQAGLCLCAPIEVWTALGTNTQINYSTHGIFRYFGKFPSTIATHLIMQYTKESGTVMDPMVGSGSTVLEALLSNRNCRSYDVNPLSILLSKVKVTRIEKQILEHALDTIRHKYRPMSIEEFNWEPIGIKNIDHWFLPETQNSIRGLIFLINNISNSDVRNFCLVILAASIRTVSRATTQQGRLFLDVATAKEDCLETFMKKAKKAVESVSGLPEKKAILEISLHDALTPFKFDTPNDLIIVHPPYFNSYKYSSVNSLELAWLRIDHANIRKNEIREFFKVGKAENVTRYIRDMVAALSNFATTLKPNGVMGLMVGDTIIKNQYVRTTKLLLDEFLSNSPCISLEKIALRVPKYTEASWSASQRRASDKIGINLNDFIVIFRRNK